MESEVVSLDRLFPIEPHLNGLNLCYLLRTLPLPKIPPGTGVAYHDRVILADGHHRAWIASQVDLDLPIKIIRTDAEIRICHDGALSWHYRSIEQFIDKFETEWARSTLERGITDVGSYKLKNDTILVSADVSGELVKLLQEAKRKSLKNPAGVVRT